MKFNGVTDCSKHTTFRLGCAARVAARSRWYFSADQVVRCVDLGVDGVDVDLGGISASLVENVRVARV